MIISYDELKRRLTECKIPDYMHESVIEYILHGYPVGHFLAAVFSNDLKEACGRADDANLQVLTKYVFFLYNYAPSGCWGRPARFEAWRRHGGLEGLRAESEEMQ